MKRINSVKKALRNILILPSTDLPRLSSPPAPSDPLITITHLYAADPSGTGTLIKYPGAPISLVPELYTGGNLRYNTDNSATYRASLAILVRTAKMTLLFAESFTPSSSWDPHKLQANAAAHEARNAVECKLLPLLNIHSGATEMGSAWFDMEQGKFMRELVSAAAVWGANMALLVRWREGRLRDKPLPPLPPPPAPDKDDDDGEFEDNPRRITVWPGPNAPR